MLRFIIWIIIIFIAAKIISMVVRSVRLYFTPNKDVFTRKTQQRTKQAKEIEDIPYEEIKDKQ